MNRPKEVRSSIQLQFLTSAVNMQGCPADGFPEVALVGRSNAGKSSLINGLANARIALVSSTPGKTRLLNFYKGPHYRLVDMPGYGFAARSGGEQKAWQSMVETFLAVRGNLVGLLIIMDIRREWSEDEDNLLKWIALRELPVVVIATKADKLSRSEVLKRIKIIQKDSGVQHVFPTSALKKVGFSEVEDYIYKAWVKAPGAGANRGEL